MSEKEVNKPIKKCIFCILIVVSIIIVSVFVVRYLPVIIYHHKDVWRYCADYEQYADDFNLVKDYIVTEFPDEDGKWVSVSRDAEKRIRMFDPDIGEYIDLPDEVVAALDIISRNGFPHKDSVFDFIRIHKGRISFCIENGRYALVYSPDERPTWLHSPTENVSVKVKKIQDGWYHVVTKS